MYFFKALANRFWLRSKSCSSLNKIAHGSPVKQTSEKVNSILLKVD